LKDTESSNFWKPILLDKTFHEFVRNKYEMASNTLLSGDTLDDKLSKMMDKVGDEVNMDGPIIGSSMSNE
jgi:hypothetical protein